MENIYEERDHKQVSLLLLRLSTVKKKIKEINIFATYDGDTKATKTVQANAIYGTWYVVHATKRQRQARFT